MSAHSPATLDELWPLLASGALPLAGGTDLLVKLKGKPRPWPALASLDRIAELAHIHEGQDGLMIGAACKVRRIGAHKAVAQRLPLLGCALSKLGSPLIRNMATVGGNLATASPAGDSIPALLALDASLHLQSAQGQRRIKVQDFLLGPGRQALSTGEIIAGVFIPWPKPDCVQHFEKVGGRKALAVSVASLAALIELDDKGCVRAARLALGSVAPTAVMAVKTAEALIGHSLSLNHLLAAADILRTEIAPIDDVRASCAHRSLVAGKLLLRLASAL